MLAFTALLLPAWAYDVKEATSPLDARAFAKPQLRVVPALAMAEHVTASLTNLSELDAYVAEYGPAWYLLVEQKSGRVNLADGGAIPFIPGNANRLTARDLGLSCGRNDCIPVSEVEALARQFLRKLTGNTESCKRLDDLVSPSCAGLTEEPAGGAFFWYLVTGWNAAGEGHAGNATAGPRQLNSAGPCS
jgi:hypothetical protein